MEVSVTSKDAAEASNDDPLADLNSPAKPFPILIRTSDGKASAKSPSNASYDSKVKKSDALKRGNKAKISTVVEADDLETFFARYAECCKIGMGAGLKKRDRRKKAKGKGGGKG
ncbi:MAG: hypothetical protein M1831_006009 [Alyxoria varia]|nr:MAG: hypothetical protein M1831_006009 [Alyxoria varia]